MEEDLYRQLFGDEFIGEDFGCSDNGGDLPTPGDLLGSDKTFPNMIDEPPTSSDLLGSDETFPDMIGNYSPEFFSDLGGLLESDETFPDMIGEPPTSGEMSNSGNYQCNFQSSQGCNGPSQMTNQFAQYEGELSNSGNDQYNSQSSQGCNGPSEKTNQFPQYAGPMLNSCNYGSGFESSQGFKGQSLMTKQFLPEVGGELSNSRNDQYNSQSSQGCNGPSEKTNQFPQYAGPMLNSGNYGSGFESSQGFKGQSLMTKQFIPEVGDEELELRNRKRKSQESQMAMSERISDVLEKGSIAENVVPDAAQSMSGATTTSSKLPSTAHPITYLRSRNSCERRCITVPQFQFSVEVPRTTDSFLLKRIIMEKAVAEFREKVGIILQVKKYEDEPIIQSETAIPQESWPKPKPSQSPVRENVNEIKIPSDHTGIYYENKIEPKPPQALVSPCPQSGANLIHHPCDIPHPSTRYAPTPDVVPQETHDRNTNTLGHKSMAIDEGTSSSRELMVSPGADVNTLVPHQVCPKSNSSKKNKGMRRKNKEPGSKNEGPSRKVYTIPEVEALVKSVEKCGIGRWQLVKSEAFNNDDTRNADDMRDKWKSLVETARRPPEDRRGLVPPDELLEKVLELEGAKEVARANGTSKPKRQRS